MGSPRVCAGKLSDPQPVGSAAGQLSNEWRERTGVRGEAVVAVAVIDSHVVLPAVGAYGPGVMVGALGTSAAYLLLDDKDRPMPATVEGRADGAALPDLWCYEAGQAAFGDVLAWFVRTFPRSSDIDRELRRVQSGGLSAGPRAKPPRRDRLVERQSRAVWRQESYEASSRASTFRPAQSIFIARSWTASALGARSIVDEFREANLPVDRIVLTSGLAKSNPFLLSDHVGCSRTNHTRARDRQSDLRRRGDPRRCRRRRCCKFCRRRRHIWSAPF